jgi:tetratricopeptide (TPR) repeat protein
MRVLFLTCQPPHHMAPPRLGDEQIDCGPCFTNLQIAGRWITRTTPFGRYDVASLPAELATAGQTPDLVVCHVDCGFCLKPVNLGVFRCPKILLAADSHWGDHAISSLVNYAVSEPFDRVVLLYDRHHADFYRAAGVKNLHWFPGLTFAHPDTRIEAATTADAPRGAHLALVGKTGYHARRQRLFAALIEAKVPLAWRQLRQSELIAHYASALIGLNAAMNGDLNLRVFEVLAGGAMLLTDRLAPAAGLDDILGEGREKISYDHAEDLVAKARHFLTHPHEARTIGRAGHRWFLENFSETHRREAFLDLAFNGRDHPAFPLHEPTVARFHLGPSFLGACDVVNELHRQQETVVVRADASISADVEPFISILPRASLTHDTVTPANLALTRVGDIYTATPLAPPRPALTPLQKLAAAARHHLDAGDLQGALERGQKAVAGQPQNPDALLVMAELAAEVGNQPLHEKMLAAVRRIAPYDPRVPLLEWSVAHLPTPRQPARLIASAWRAYESLDFLSAEKYVALALAADQRLADAAYITGLVHSRRRADPAPAEEKLRRLQLEVAAFQRAAELAPDRADCAFAVAVRLGENGSPSSAIPFYERATQIDPGHAAAWLGLGQARLETGDITAAVAAFSAGLRRAPAHLPLQQALAMAAAHTTCTEQAFAHRLIEIQDARSDCQKTKCDPQWKQWVKGCPSIAVVRTIAGQPDALPFGETIRLLISAGAAAVETGGTYGSHDEAPARTALMAYQPWFDLDTRRIVVESFDQGLLTILLDDEVSSAPATPDFTHNNFRTLTHRDITLWHLAKHRICLELGCVPAAIDAADPRHAAVIGITFARAIALVDRVLAYVGFYQPATVLMAQGHDLLSATLRHVAVRRGLRVVAIENIFRSDRLLWDDTSGIAVNQNLAKNHYWRHRDLISENDARRSVSAFFANRSALKSVEHTTPDAPLPPRSENALRTIAYLAQVAVDSSVLFGLRGFESQAEVITALAEFAARRGHRLLIKLHPKESPHHPDPQGWYQRHTIRALDAHAAFQAARAALGERLVLDSDNTCDTCEFIRQADVCVTINSQAGLEAALLDREVVLCGDAFYGGLGFTQEATDASSLEYTLDRVLRDGLRVNDGRDAYLFYHIFTELYCLPKTVGSIVCLLSGRPDFCPTPTLDPSRVQPNLVYDVGMNNGDDTAYYGEDYSFAVDLHALRPAVGPPDSNTWAPPLASPFPLARVAPRRNPAAATSLDPRELLSPHRLDVVVKYLYFCALDGRGDLTSAEELYRRHVIARTGGIEPPDATTQVPSSKQNAADYIAAAQSLFHGMREKGYDTAHPIPITDSGGLANGAHRLACALALGWRVTTTTVDAKPGPAWDAAWFTAHGFDDATLLRLLHAWSGLMPARAAMFLLWAPVEAAWPEMETDIARDFSIVGALTMEFAGSPTTFREVVLDCYSHDSDPRHTKHIERKLDLLANYPDRFRIVLATNVSRAESTGELATKVKQRLRRLRPDLAPSNKFISCHANTSTAELQHLRATLLDASNLAMIALRPAHGPRPTFLTWLGHFRETLAREGLPLGECCVVGSSTLEVLGLRHSTDIDFTLKANLRHPRFGSGITHLADGVDIVTEGYHRVAAPRVATSDDELIDDSHHHFLYRGIKFAAPQIVLDRKDFSRRPKDIADVELLRDFFVKSQSTTAEARAGQ